MQRLRQILAILGIILLVALYLLTIIAAIFDNTNTMSYPECFHCRNDSNSSHTVASESYDSKQKKHDNDKKGNKSFFYSVVSSGVRSSML